MKDNYEIVLTDQTADQTRPTTTDIDALGRSKPTTSLPTYLPPQYSITNPKGPFQGGWEFKKKKFIGLSHTPNWTPE